MKPPFKLGQRVWLLTMYPREILPIKWEATREQYDIWRYQMRIFKTKADAQRAKKSIEHTYPGHL
jgi:hypothetical protein